MELIQDIDVCKGLVEKRKDSLSNCFFMPDQMRGLVDKEKLYHQNIGDNFLILHKEPSFYRVYYFIKDPDQLDPVKLDKPAVIEFPFRGEMTEGQKRQVRLIEKMGFHLERESARMSMGMEEFDYERKMVEFPNVKIDYAKEEDAEEIWRLFHETFDELFAFLLSKEELVEHIKSHFVIAAYHKGKIAGATSFEVSGKIVNGGQLAISQIGSGIGWLLMNKFHVLLREKVKISRFWVDTCNKSAIAMYKKAGYKYDGCKANEYVCRL